MKFNEPVRPASIGRKQVAFEIGNNPSALTLIENDDNDNNDSQSQIGQDNATLAETMKLARVAAYSAASSGVANNTNRIWGTQSIRNWTHYANNLFPTTSLIHWADDVDNLGNIRSGLAYVDTADPTIIRVTKAGWYLVNVHFYQGDHTLNNNKNGLYVISSDSPDTTTGVAYNYVTGYPSLGISQLVPVPGYNANGDPASPNASHGQGGFQVVWQVGPHQNVLDITSTNSYAFIQIVWLMPWESDLFYNGA
jgi:hypothetical protein